MMIQLLIQFQKYILSTIYIYISFYIWVFQLKVIPKYRWTFLDDTIPLTYPSRDFHTHTHTYARATSDQEENCFHFPSMFLEATFLKNLTHPAFRGKWREWEKRKRGRERERKRNDGVFFFSGPWRVESARLKYRAGGIMLRQRWVNGDVDRRKFHSAHGRARRSMFQLGKNGKIDDWGKNSCAAFDLKNFQLSLSDI